MRVFWPNFAAQRNRSANLNILFLKEAENSEESILSNDEATNNCFENGVDSRLLYFPSKLYIPCMREILSYDVGKRKRLCLQINNMVAESKDNEIILFNKMSKFQGDNPTLCEREPLYLSDILNIDSLINNNRPEYFYRCNLKELSKVVLMIMTKREELQSDLSKSDEIFKCSDLAPWVEKLLRDYIKTINHENFDIISVKHHLLFRSPKSCVDFVEEVYRMIERHPDKQKLINKLNKDGKKHRLKISFKNYKIVEVGGRSMKVTDFKHHRDVKKITGVWEMIKFIRDMNQHGHEKKYPERREWLGFSDEGCDYEKFLKNVLEICPGLLAFLWNRYGRLDPERPRNVNVDENNNIINRFE